MPLSIGVNLRVTGHCNQGGRKYMEDMFSVAYQQTPDDKDLEYAFFGIFDGHGGGEAATFAKEHLMDIIVKQKNFWSDRDEDVLRAIRDGYVNTHYAMWRELDKWPRTASGLPSTAGTTASIAFIRKGKIYIGHVGDSGIILGYQTEGDPQWKAKALTKDHKPESGPEMIRIQESGGKVVNKSGVPRVVWNRPRIGHKGPVRRSTHIDEIPFLAVARSLGDLWSYNSELNTFVVSPEPDVRVVAVDVKSHRCLIFGTDGLWNMLSPQAAVSIVQAAERHNENHLIASQQTGAGQTDDQMWINPSKSLVDRALERWSSTRLRADNTSVVTLMLDPPGPSRSEVLLNQKKDKVLAPRTVIHSAVPATIESIEKSASSVAKPVIPKPPTTTNIEAPELKQPDSSNETNGSFEPTPKIGNLHCSEELPVKNCQEDINIDSTPNTDVEEKVGGESIQVAEISSSDIQEETTDTKGEDLEKVQLLEEGKVQNIEKVPGIEEVCDSASVQNLDKKNPDSEQVTNLKDAEDESKGSGMIRQNAFSGTCNDLKPLHFMSRVRRRAGIMTENNLINNELKNNSSGLNLSHPKQHTIFSNLADAVRTVTRGHSLSMQTQNGHHSASAAATKTYVTVSSRFKARSTPPSVISNTEEETVRNALGRTGNTTVGTKRRHSTISQSGAVMEESCTLQEPSVKRRTRSEDRRNPTDENDPANQTREEPNSRLSWPTAESSLAKSAGSSNNASVQERLSSSNTYHRRSLGKKTTPAKTIRRSSINSSNRLQQLRGSFGLREWDQGKNNRAGAYNERRPNRSLGIMGSMVDLTSTPQRWLRSDTMAATPVKTLRSRNVDITGHTISAQLVHHYDVVKQNRLSLPSKVKQSNGHGALQSGRVRSSSLSSSKLKQTAGNSGSIGNCSAINISSAESSSSSGIAKRVKSPYNPSARSLTTRSRIKRLGK